MKINMNDIEIVSKIPRLPSSLPVFRTKKATLNDRKHAIEILSEELKLSKLHAIEVEDSIHMLSKEGELQYYRPSGALWARNIAVDTKFEDERRSWKTEKVPDEENKEDFKLILPKTIERQLVEKTQSLFKRTELIGKHAYFADVSLEQISEFDEKGKEINRFAGEATVRFLYKLNEIKVDGGGAKSYTYFYPNEEENDLVGIYHAWREIIDSRSVKLLKIEEAIERALSRDGELTLYHEKKHKIQLRKIELIYYALPPSRYQEFVFPAMRIIGSVTPISKNADRNGFEFARYYHIVHPDEYVKAEFYAHYLISRL